MITAKSDHYQFTFAFWDRAHGFRVILEGIKLLLTGRCVITVNMHNPRDMEVMRGGLEASREYDAVHGSAGGSLTKEVAK